MKNFLKILCLTLCCSSFSQTEYTLSGYAKEKATGEELLGVNILLSQSSGTTTNEYGFFSITLPEGVYTVQISYLGFKTITQEINLNKNTKINFELEEDTNKLDEVVINSSTQKQTASVRSTQMSVVKLSSNTIKNSLLL